MKLCQYKIDAPRLWLAAAVLLALANPAHASDWPLHLAGELAAGYDDNHNNAHLAEDAKSSAQGLAAVSADTSWQPTAQSSFRLASGVQQQVVERYRRLDSSRYWLQGGARYRLGNDFFAPLFSASAEGSVLDSRSALRDGYTQRYVFALAEPLTTRIGLRLSLEAGHQQARSAVFKLGHRSTAVQVDYSASERFLVYAAYQYRLGDFAATVGRLATVPTTVKASAADDAYGTVGTAFRQGGRANEVTLGANYALSPRWAIELQSRFAEVESDIDTHYQRWQTTASLLWRY